MTTIATAVPKRVPLPKRWWRGRDTDPAWVRPALLGLLAATAAALLWGLSASGYANQFYSAAAQAGSVSWKAFFFGSSDAGNSITVDKPPAALWPMALSVRLFGLSAWSILVPQALMGVASVGAVYATVRRGFGSAAGLLAGASLALTPVAALMFRFNNPDALLCLLSVLAVYCVVRAVEAGATRWLIAAGALLGFAFLVKTLQAWLIVPVLAGVYLAWAPVRPLRRVWQLLGAAAAMVAACGWWIAIVELWPASSRPYIGGSQNNSFLELTFGYNGFGRITGDEAGSVGGGRGWGSSGITRLFDSSNGGQIAWLLPTALVLFAVSLYLLRRSRFRRSPDRGRVWTKALWWRRPAQAARPTVTRVRPWQRRSASWSARRGNAQRAQLWLWGGSLLVTAAVFSYMAGIFHEYYTVALAPYIAALVGIGATVLWRRRRFRAVAVTLAVVTAGTAGWAFVLLGRSDWLPWLRWAVLGVGLAAGAGLLFARRLPKRLAVAIAGLALAAVLAGPFAYTAYTVATEHSGSIVTAGPAVDGGRGGAGGQRMAAYGDGQGGPPGADGGGQGQRDGNGQGAPPGADGQNSNGSNGSDGDGQGSAQNGPGRQGGMGGLLNGQSVSDELAELLATDAEAYTWAAAATGSQNASSYQLATGEAVMPIGGFNGTDPSPTLDQFKQYVADDRIHFYIAAGGTSGGPGGDDHTAAAIAEWVADNFDATTVGGATVYDLSG